MSPVRSDLSVDVPPDVPAAEGARPDAPPIRPVTVRDRIVSIDVLRGVAVLGILAMNIYAFAMPWAAYSNPLKWGEDSPLNRGAWYLTHLLFDLKFMAIFSMLFGAGLILMWERAGGRPIGRVWYRRQVLLLIIGAIHAYLIWFGDILVMYAVIGMLVFLVRRWPAKRLIVVGVLWMLPALLLGTGGGFWQMKFTDMATAAKEKVAAGEELSDEEAKILEEYEMNAMFMNPSDEDIAETARVHREGTYVEIVKSRVPVVAMMQTAGIFFFGIWRVGGLMMLGMGLMKLGVFSASLPDRVYRRMIAWGYGVGLPLAAISAWQLTIHDWDGIYVQLIGGYWNYVASIAVAIGHVGLVMLAVRRRWWQGLLDRFSAVGRMAFTNYLMQSILCTLIFYSYGLGLYGTLDRWQQLLVAVAIWILQLAYSPWWLDRFRFGPAEWLWRTLTYGRRPRFRRDRHLSADGAPATT